MWTFTGPRRVPQEVLYVVAGAKGISRAVPEHDANLIVFGSVIQQVGERDVHGHGHCIFLLRSIQLNPQDVSKERSVIMSLIPYLLGGLRRRGWSRDDSACAQALNFVSLEPEFFENFVVMLAKLGRSPCRYFCDAMHLNRTTDCKFQVFSRAFERHYDVVRLELRILDHVLRIAYQTVGDVRLVQDFAPVPNRL